MNNSALTLRITEIFHSLQGESNKIGLPTVFIRLTGCPLRCQYCDTAYAFKGGKIFTIEEIITKTKSFNCKDICITGGEPLSQPNCLKLMRALCDLDLKVSIETSGALDITNIDPRVHIVMDLKTPGSKEEHRNLWSNLKKLKATDEIKFVICNRDDYNWACACIKNYNLTTNTNILFSPSAEELHPTTLAQWILDDKLSVRFQIQLHKFLWSNAKGR